MVSQFSCQSMLLQCRLWCWALLLETLNEAGAGLGSLLIWLLLLPGASPASCTPQSAATCCVTLDDNHCYGLATYYVSRRRGEGVRQMLTIADGRVGGGAKIWPITDPPNFFSPLGFCPFMPVYRCWAFMIFILDFLSFICYPWFYHWFWSFFLVPWSLILDPW